MSKNLKRAERRHQVLRRRRWAQRELAGMIDCHPDAQRRLKFAGMLAETPALCSCWMCGNPRRYFCEPTPRGGDWLEDDLRSWRDAGLDVVVSLLARDEMVDLGLQEEEQRSRAEGLEFYSFPIPDMGVPESREATAALVGAIEQALEAGKSVAVHCRQGIGRSSLIVASALVAAGLGSDEAFRRIEAARGLPVPETDAQRRWVEHLSSKSLTPARDRAAAP